MRVGYGGPIEPNHHRDSARDPEDAVELVVPAQARHARLCRLVASGVATSAGLDYEAVSDFRIAVDELVSTLIESTHQAVALRFWIEPDSIVVEGRSTGPKREEPAVDRLALSHQILDVVADAYEYGIDEGVAHFRLVKRTGAPERPSARATEMARWQ